jgi:iron complex outermembrane recepter protein
MKKLLLFCISIFLTTAVFCQSKTQLSGKITDAKTGEPLLGASVILAESKVGTTTDSSGNYLLKNIPLGHTLIEVSFSGYRSIVDHLDINAGGNSKDFALTASFVENEVVTITAVGNATSARKAPIPITRVSRSELLATPATNIIDAISKQPGVSQITSGPAISKPVIRGLGYNRLVVINDGVRQEGQQWGDEHGIEIDENSVSRIEIVKGPASLIYGSDAMAGVVNIITTSPVQVNTIKGSILSNYNTNNKQRSFFGSLGGNQNGFNWNAWGDLTAAGDYKNKYDDRVWNSKFNSKNFGGYFGYNGVKGFSHLIVSNFSQKVGVIEGDRNPDGSFIKALPNGIDGIPSEDDFNSSTPYIPYQQIGHLKIIADNSFHIGSGKVTLNVAWQRNQRQEFGNIDDPAEKSLFFDLQTVNYNVAYHFADRKGWATSIGIGGMQQSNLNKGVEVLIPEYDLFDIGGFGYTQKTIGKATFSGGIRFDNRTLDSKMLVQNGDLKFAGFKKDFSNLSGSIGLSYATTHNFVLKLNLARGFRAPSIPELASNGAHEGTNRYEYGDPNLKSEISWQSDFGFELNSEHVLFSANAFYNRIDNFIFYSKLSSSNGGDSLVEVGQDLIPAYKFEQQTASLAGFEALLDFHPHPLDWLHWKNTFSYVKGNFHEPIEGTKNVPFIPATRFLSEFRVELLSKGKTVRNLLLFAGVDHAFDQNNPFTAFGTETATPGYTLLNAGVTANFTRKTKTLFTIYIFGNNLTDEAYQNHLSRLKYTEMNSATGRQGVFNMGRNFVFKLNIPLNFDFDKSK